MKLAVNALRTSYFDVISFNKKESRYDWIFPIYYFASEAFWEKKLPIT